MNIFNKNKDKRIELSFQKIKEDVLCLQQEIIILKQEIQEINYNFNAFLSQFKQALHSNKHPTHVQHMKHLPTHNLPNKALNQQYFHSSIGNNGVPTDSQQIVNRHLDTINRTSSIPRNFHYRRDDFQNLRGIYKQKSSIEPTSMESNPMDSNQVNIPQLSNIVSNMKQELQDKFKKLTKQEFFDFSILYALEEEKGNITYRDIAQRANLAESSVRDYISRLEYKGIPVVKERINNKIVLLRISPELRNIATLDSLSKIVKF